MPGLAKSFFGSGSSNAAGSVPPPVRNFNITTPGFRLRSNVSGTPSPVFTGTGRGGPLTDLVRNTTLERTGPVQEAFARSFASGLNDFASIRRLVQPGAFAAIREAGFGRLAATRSSTIGNLRESLARRGVLGSSFADDAISRTRAELGQREAEFAAQIGKEELDFRISNGLRVIEAERNFILSAITKELQELQVSAGVPVAIENLINENARIKASALAADAANTNKSAGLFFDVAKAVAGGLGTAGIPGEGT